MRQLKERGASILIVTHRIAELVRIADRATVLRDGVDVGRLEKAEITEERILELIAGPQRERAQHDQGLPERQSDQPVLRATEVRVWPDAKSFNFKLYPGEIIGVTGLDGQGQADFVRCLAGIQTAPSGRITLIHDEAANDIHDLASARRNKVSYVSGDREKRASSPISASSRIC